MFGYLMALYSDYKGRRGGGEGRNRKKTFNDGIT